MTENKQKIECLEPKIQIGPPIYFPTSTQEIKENEILSKKVNTKTITEQIEKKNQKEKRNENKFDVIYYKVQKVDQDTKLHLYKNKEKGNQEKQTLLYGHWTDDEHQRFLEGFRKLGRKWSIIADQYVKTRTSTQVTSHAQQYIDKKKMTHSIEDLKDIKPNHNM